MVGPDEIKLIKLKGILQGMRVRLLTTRPLLPSFRRKFTYEEEEPPHREVTAIVCVELRKFNAHPMFEQKAYDLGQSIKNVKFDIDQLELKIQAPGLSAGRIALMRGEE